MGSSELKHLDSVVSPQVRLQAQKAATVAEQQGYHVRALLSFLNVDNEDWMKLCMAQAVNPRGGWRDVHTTGSNNTAHSARHGSGDGSGTKRKKKRDSVDRGFKKAAAAHAEWKRRLEQRRCDFSSLHAHQLDDELRGVYAAYCDQSVLGATGNIVMTIAGFMRLLFDCSLLDNVTTPTIVDWLCSGTSVQTPRRSSTKDLQLDYALFRDCLARVAAQRHAVREAKKIPAWKNPPPPDIQDSSFLEPLMHLGLPAKFPAPPPKPHGRASGSNVVLMPRHSIGRSGDGPLSARSLSLSAENGMPRASSLRASSMTHNPAASRPVSSMSNRRNGHNRSLSGGPQGSMNGRGVHYPDDDGKSLAVKSVFSASYRTGVLQKQSSVCSVGGLRTEVKLEPLQPLHKQWRSLVKDWILPLASAKGTSVPSPVDWVFTRSTLDMLHGIEPGLRKLYGWYAFLDDPSHLPWLRLITLNAAVDARHLTEMLHNFLVVPSFIPRAQVCASYGQCPATDGRQGVFDGGQSFPRFLVTLAILGIRIAEDLQPRIQVNLTPEELRDVRRYLGGVGPPARRDQLEQLLSNVEAARRRTLDDEGRGNMGFFDYAGKRLEAERQAQESDATLAHHLKVIDRREELRQNLALTRLHNYYADVRVDPRAHTASGAGVHDQPSGASLFSAHQHGITMEQQGHRGDRQRRGDGNRWEDGPSPINVAFFSDQVPIKTPKIVLRQVLPPLSRGRGPSLQGNVFMSPRTAAGALPSLQPANNSSSHQLPIVHEGSQLTSMQSAAAVAAQQSTFMAATHQLRSSRTAVAGPTFCQVMAIEARDGCDILSDFTSKLPTLKDYYNPNTFIHAQPAAGRASEVKQPLQQEAVGAADVARDWQEAAGKQQAESEPVAQQAVHDSPAHESHQPQPAAVAATDQPDTPRQFFSAPSHTYPEAFFDAGPFLHHHDEQPHNATARSPAPAHTIAIQPYVIPKAPTALPVLKRQPLPASAVVAQVLGLGGPGALNGSHTHSRASLHDERSHRSAGSYIKARPEAGGMPHAGRPIHPDVRALEHFDAPRTALVAKSPENAMYDHAVLHGRGSHHWEASNKVC